MHEYKTEIIRIVDGDTVDVWIDLGFNVRIKERVRLAGIDTPESRTRDLREKKFGKLATARVAELLPVGESFIATSMKLNKRGKFGRCMMDFQIPGSDTICKILMDEFLAVSYHGQNKLDVRSEHEKNWDYLEGKDV